MEDRIHSILRPDDEVRRISEDCFVVSRGDYDPWQRKMIEVHSQAMRRSIETGALPLILAQQARVDFHSFSEQTKWDQKQLKKVTGTG